MEKEKNSWHLLEDIWEMAIVFSEDGRICYGNQAARALLEYDDFTDILIFDIFPGYHPKAENTSLRQLEKGIQEMDASGVDLMAYRQNHTCFRTEARFVHPDGEIGNWLCLARDVSRQDFLNREIVKVKQEAEEAAKVKDEFVANVTHELRTPVNGILGHVKLLREQEEDDSKQKTLDLVERGCHDMYSIINNILDFSKLEAGKFQLERKKFVFRDMIDYVKANHINKINEKGLGFFVTVSPTVPESVISDELRICQILNNLLSNACKFTSVGKITLEVVKTAQVGNRAELFFLVIDTGIGISREDQDKLFKSFSQVDASISRRYGGTGLGLFISKELVELLGGTIEVKSDFGKGSMFSFSIWVEVPEEELEGDSNTAESAIDRKAELKRAQSVYQEEDASKQFGTSENKEELKKLLAKLVLSVEMENWEKAEMFMESIRELTKEAPQEIKTAALRLKMAVQKANYDKIMTAYETLRQQLVLG